MATVIHIEKVAEVGDVIAIPPGATWPEIMQACGCESRFEFTADPPRPPRKVSPKASEFISRYKREDPNSILAVFWRHHSLEAEEFDAISDAESFLESGEEYGTLASEAIVASDGTITACD